MSKINIITIGIIVLLLFISVSLYAQKPGSEQFITNNPEYNALSRKIDELSAATAKADAEIVLKLEQVLANQDKILKELDVVRVRASRGR